MPLTAPTDRLPRHVRDVLYRSFERADGLWDIEGELRDSKAMNQTMHGKPLPAGTAIHHLWIRVTIDTALQVHSIEAAMDAYPLGTCQHATAALQKMVGCSMARNWRKSIQEHLGGVASCTHLRELLVNMATAAFQSMPKAFHSDDATQPPRHLGQCTGWDFQGPGVATHYPRFIGYVPVAPKPAK